MFHFLVLPGYLPTDPIVHNTTWSPEADAQSQVYWQKAVSSALKRDNIIQAGVFASNPDYQYPSPYCVAELAPVEKSSGALRIVKGFSDHVYAQTACGGHPTELKGLMDHSNISRSVTIFEPEVMAARKANKSLVFGETNSGATSPKILCYGRSFLLADACL